MSVRGGRDLPADVLTVDFAGMQNRLDAIDRRVHRIEQRLELVEIVTPS